VGAVVMTLMAIVLLAVSVVESRDRVRRDFRMDDAGLRSWYDARYARGGREFSRENLEHALRRAQFLRRWTPVALSAGTLLVAVALTVFAVSMVPGVESAWRTPQQLLNLIPAEILVETAAVFLLLPVLIVEGILAALYTADLDIGRLQRLLDSID
jgi:hypothetical protein